MTSRLLDPQLQAFLCVAEEGTVQGAAKKLFLTQTAITQRVKGLEKKLSVTLFLRTQKGMVLTAEGRRLLRYGQEVLRVEGQLLPQFSFGDIPLTLLGPTSVMSARVIPALLPLYPKYPELLLSLQLLDSDFLLDELKKGRGDLVIVPPKQVGGEFDSKMLRPEEYVLVGTRNWKNRPLEDILKNEMIIDFNPEDHLSFDYLQHFSLMKWVSRKRIFVNQNAPLIDFFIRGFGYGVLTLEVAKSALESGKLILLNQGKIYKNPLALAWYPRNEMPKYFKELCSLVK